MLPTESGNGQLYQHDGYLCDLLYEIDYPLGFVNIFRVLHLKFTPQNYDPALLVDSSGLMVVTAGGTKYHLPPPLELQEDGTLQCTINLMT